MALCVLPLARQSVLMPRTSRAIVANHYYHVINRGNDQLQRFHDRGDYSAFLWLIGEANDHAPLPIIGADRAARKAIEFGLEKSLAPLARPRKRM
jgi:hypothetical protein